MLASFSIDQNKVLLVMLERVGDGGWKRPKVKALMNFWDYTNEPSKPE
jgi:hypothetical protein